MTQICISGGGGGAALPLSPKNVNGRAWLHGDTLIAVIVLLPSMIAVAIFIYGFILWTGYISTVKWNSTVVDYTFVGLKNWIQLFQMDRFHWDLRNLVLYAIGFMGQCIIFGFLIAVLLDQKIKGEALFRTIVIFPFAVSAIVTGVAWRWLMQPIDRPQSALCQPRSWRVSSLPGMPIPSWGMLAIYDRGQLAVHRLRHGALPGRSARHPRVSCARRRPSTAPAPGPPIAT